MPAVPTPPAKPGLHPRNRHRHGYDFAALSAALPELAAHLVTTPAGSASIDFSQPAAVRALNRALLATHYGVAGWDIPPRYLCPPVPGRADLLHHLADLLAGDNGGHIPTGKSLRVLDVGVGANGVYPLIGHAEYGWRFVGVDIDAPALAALRRVLAANPRLATALELRLQAKPEQILLGVLQGQEKFDLTLCNPPFHDSPAQAAAAAQRKWRQLGRSEGPARGGPPRLNFGGRHNELCCPGGERGFIERMIEQSRSIAPRVLWFSSLVSRSENLRPLEAALRHAHVADSRIIPMAQGQKQSRLLAWTFHDRATRADWAQRRWHEAGTDGQ